jgi:hypothetical protein
MWEPPALVLPNVNIPIDFSVGNYFTGQVEIFIGHLTLILENLLVYYSSA